MRCLRMLILVVLAAAAGSGQSAYVLTRGVSEGVRPASRTYLPDPAYPAGTPFVPLFLWPTMPNWYAGSLVATGTPLPPVGHEGGLAIDQVTGIVYATDGTSFLSEDTLHDDGVGATPSSGAGLPLPGGPPGPITGLAVDPDSGFLWICDGTSFQARSKTAPYPAASPVMPIPPFPGVPGATGLGFDPATATLWACNVDGATVELTLGGALVSMHPALPGPHGPVRGLDVNPANGMGSFPPAGGQIGGFHVCVTDGDAIFDALPPYASISSVAGLPTYCRGLAIASDPSVLAGGYNTVSMTYRHDNDPIWAPFLPQSGIVRPTVSGPVPSPNFATVDNAAAGAGLFLIADLLPLPTGVAQPGLVVNDDVLWVNPFSPTHLMLPLAADASGHGMVYLPFESLPAGLTFCVQWLVADASAYLGYVFTDAHMIKIGLR